MSAEEDPERNHPAATDGCLEPISSKEPLVPPNEATFGEYTHRQTNPAGQQPADKPTPFDRSLANTDRTIKWFTVFSGLAAVASAGAAIYTASTLGGSSRQMDNAITDIAADAAASRDQANALSNEVIAIRDEASATKSLISPAASTAKAAEGQLSQMRKENRPFISVSEPKITGPTEVFPNDGGLIINMSINVEVSGSIPAVNIVSLTHVGGPDAGDWIEDQHRLCNDKPLPTLRRGNRPVFSAIPGQGAVLPIIAVVDRSEVSRDRKRGFTAIPIYVYGCVKYSDGRGRWFTTGYIYDVISTMGGISIDHPTAATDLRIGPDLYGTGPAT